jgi:hypothetical protein
MMIGNGTPSSQNNKPFPNPISISSHEFELTTFPTPVRSPPAASRDVLRCICAKLPKSVRNRICGAELTASHGVFLRYVRGEARDEPQALRLQVASETPE